MSQEKFNDKYRIPSARNPHWDYSSAGAYFVTICTANRENYFGIIRNGKMELSEIGKIAFNFWNEIPNHFPFVTLDEFIIMPDHVHGILIFYGTAVHGVVSGCRDAKFCVSTPNTTITLQPSSQQSQSPQNVPIRHPNKFGPQSKNLGSVVRGFKSAVKTYATNNNIDFAWQSRYHDRIIRDRAEFNMIKNYIINNPLNGEKDECFLN